MTKNVGTIDRILRAVLGLALIGCALKNGPLWTWIGVVPLATAAFSFCPLYSVLGFKTCPAPNRSEPK